MDACHAANAWIGVVSGLGGVVVGWILGEVHESRKRRARKEERQRRIAGAFRGEVSALASIVELRGYLQTIEQAIEHVERTHEPLRVRFHARKEYFPVFENNASEIGILPRPIPELLARFYVQAKSILEDVEDPAIYTWREELERLRQLKALFESNDSLAHELIERLEKVDPPAKS